MKKLYYGIAWLAACMLSVSMYAETALRTVYNETGVPIQVNLFYTVHKAQKQTGTFTIQPNQKKIFEIEYPSNERVTMEVKSAAYSTPGVIIPPAQTYESNFLFKNKNTSIIINATTGKFKVVPGIPQRKVDKEK